MKYKIQKEDLENIIDNIDELSKLLDERIVDLHNIKGAMQARHAYIFYRKLVWNIRDGLNNHIEK